MDEFRDWFLRAFSGGTAASTTLLMKEGR